MLGSLKRIKVEAGAFSTTGVGTGHAAYFRRGDGIVAMHAAVALKNGANATVHASGMLKIQQAAQSGTPWGTVHQFPVSMSWANGRLISNPFSMSLPGPWAPGPGLYEAVQDQAIDDPVTEAYGRQPVSYRVLIDLVEYGTGGTTIDVDVTAEISLWIA